MIAEFGQLALILALIAAIYQGFAPFLGVMTGDDRLLRAAQRGVLAHAVFLGLAFALLTVLHAVSDFSVLNVVENSHSAKPFIYKITGVWGNHEGSILMWSLILAVYAALAGANVTEDRDLNQLHALMLGVMGGISSLFLAFVIFTSNPFTRIFPAPPNGHDLNPLLQDPGLIIHPPFLYLGYVGLAVPFAYAVAALIRGRMNRTWARIVRPWAVLAWTFLTIGIALGSWWAYYELGWGGFWAWDPVENASFMPWLAGVALIHSVRVTEIRGAFKSWTLLLAILAFSLSLVGTFLVRSGILTSVHAFAVDPTRGVFILAILATAVGGALLLYALRAPLLSDEGGFSRVSREGGLLLNNVLMVSACATVFLGTFYPLFVDVVSGEKLSVGAPYFNIVFLPFMAVALLVIAPASALSWKRGNIPNALKRVWPGAIAAIVALVISTWLTFPAKTGAVLGSGLAAWAGIGIVSDFLKRIRVRQSGWTARVIGLPSSYIAMAVAHFGLAVVALGVIGTGAWKSEAITYLEPGASVTLGEDTITLAGVEHIEGPNFVSDVARFLVNDGETQIVAERRFYPVRGMQTTEAGIRTEFFGDTYVTLGEYVEGNGWVVRAWRHPLTVWIWVGAALIACGGAFGLSGAWRKQNVRHTSNIEMGKAHAT